MFGKQLWSWMFALALALGGVTLVGCEEEGADEDIEDVIDDAEDNAEDAGDEVEDAVE